MTYYSQTRYFKTCYNLVFFFFLFCSASEIHAQVPVLKVTNGYNEQQIIYNNDSMMHTAWKPALYIDTSTKRGTGNWFHRKFFQEHLLQLRDSNFNLDADIIFDEYIGSSKRYVTTPMMNTRGYEITGNITSKFYFQTAFYENQGRFGGYLDSFIRKYKVIPGQGRYKNVGDGKGFDFSEANAKLVYMPSKHFSFDLGYGKNFIGDGYRSLLLSDWSYNYPYLKTSITYGKFQYNVMWSQYIADVSGSQDTKPGYFRKWG